MSLARRATRNSRPALPASIVAFVAVLAILGGAAVARADTSALANDLKARRARVMDRLGPDALAILWSAPPQRYSLDIDYEYRQDSNLYYLTGLTQADTILVMMPGNRAHRELLFVKDRNPAREHWTGRLMSRDEAAMRTGIDTIFATSQFDPFIGALLAGRPFGAVDEKEAERFFSALSAGHARLSLPLESDRELKGPLTPPLEFARQVRERFVGFQVGDLTPIITDLRVVKTPYEQSVLVKSLEISNDGQLAGMRAAHPGAFEYEIKAAIEAAHRARGAASWSYPSIVGSGPNATILHYPEGDRQMQAGELLLVDAACNYQYMSGDITRTYPVSGRFSPAQKDLYSLVLDAQNEGMKVARPGASLVDIHKRTVQVMKAGLFKLGLITDANSEQYRLWYTHGATHYLGIDVHDVGDRNHPLEPGMAFTIEPGVYIRQAALDALPRTAENNVFIERVQPAVQKYADIGIRIEDSFLLEASGLRRLSSAVPRTIDEIEQFLRNRQAPSPSASR